MLSRPFFPSLALKNRLTSFVVSLPSSRSNVASGVSTAMNQSFNLLGNNKNNSSRSSNSTNVSFNNSINSSIRLFHSSASLSGPKKKGGKESKEVNDEEAAPIELPKVSDFESTMDKRIGYLESEFNGLRAGRASTDMFNHIDVAAYGSKMSIAEAGQISLKSPTKLSIVAFDPQLSGAIATAIREGGMGLNPLVEGNTVMVNIPKPSKESRDLLIKTASKYSERTKQQVREVRKDAMDEIKKLKGSISEDDTRRITKEVDVLTEKKLDKVQKLFKDKETELNTA